MEPCNYVSVIAYYHSVLKLCDYDEDWSIDDVTVNDAMKVIAHITVGSAFMHASFTEVGDKLDNYMIGIIAYLGYQITMINMPDKSLMLEGLQWERRSKNITMVIDNLTRTIMNDPVADWTRVLENEDYPVEYYASFAAIIVNLAAFTLPL